MSEAVVIKNGKLLFLGGKLPKDFMRGPSPCCCSSDSPDPGMQLPDPPEFIDDSSTTESPADEQE